VTSASLLVRWPAGGSRRWHWPAECPDLSVGLHGRIWANGPIAAGQWVCALRSGPIPDDRAAVRARKWPASSINSAELMGPGRPTAFGFPPGHVHRQEPGQICAGGGARGNNSTFPLRHEVAAGPLPRRFPTGQTAHRRSAAGGTVRRVRSSRLCRTSRRGINGASAVIQDSPRTSTRCNRRQRRQEVSDALRPPEVRARTRGTFGIELRSFHDLVPAASGETLAAPVDVLRGGAGIEKTFC